MMWKTAHINFLLLFREHHCMFAGYCVGHYNHRYFLLFLGKYLQHFGVELLLRNILSRNRLISAGLEPVLDHKKISRILTISTNIKIKIITLIPVLLVRAFVTLGSLN